MHRKATFTAAVALLAIGLGCGSEPLFDFFRKNGDSNEGYFVLRPNVNLAAGAKLDVEVRDFEGAGESNPGRPKNARSSNDAIARVEGIAEGKITVAGVAAGDAVVRFEGVADQEEVEDSFNQKVIEPKRIELVPCFDGIYLRGSPALVEFHFLDGAPEAGPTRAQGYGFYPLDVSGAATVNQAHRDPFTVRVDVAPEAGDSITLRSTLPGDPTEATLPLISASEITSIELLQDGRRPGTIRPGSTWNLGLIARAAEKLVCSPLEVEIREETPGTCQLSRSGMDPMLISTLARAGKTPQGALLGAAASLAVLALEKGSCKLKVVVLTAGLKVATELLLEFAVEEPLPRGGGGGSFGDD